MICATMRHTCFFQPVTSDEPEKTAEILDFSDSDLVTRHNK